MRTGHPNRKTYNSETQKKQFIDRSVKKLRAHKPVKVHTKQMSTTRSCSPAKRNILRSPMFPTLEHKELYINRTRDDGLNEAAKRVIQAEIEGMTHDEAKAALLDASQGQEEHSSGLEVLMEEVQDLPGNQRRGTPVSDNDPTNLYGQSFAPANPPVSVLPVHPYVSQHPS